MTTEPITPERERDWVHWRSRALAAEAEVTRLRANLAEARREGAAEALRDLWAGPPACQCGMSPDPGVCHGCPQQASSHCVCSHEYRADAIERGE